MKRKRSTCLLISGILALLYLIYIISYFFGNIIGAESDIDLISDSIATAMVTPHIIFVALAFIFNAIGYFTNKFWAALTGGILYVVGGLLFISYFLFVLPSIILSFVGCARLNKINAINAQNQSSE